VSCKPCVLHVVTENETREDDITDVMNGMNELSLFSSNTSMYNEVASRLSAELLAALARSASTPDQNDASPVTSNLKNVSSTPVPASASRKSWEQFLAEVVTNLTSIRRAKVTPTTPSERSTTRPDLVTNTTVPSTSAPAVQPSDVAHQQQQLRSYHHRHHQSHVGVGRHTRPGLPLNLKSPPGVLVKNLEHSTDTPPSVSWRATTRLPPLTTPPAYLHHVTPVAGYVHHQHHHHHHSDVRRQRIFKHPPAIGFPRRNSMTNNTQPLWSKPAGQISAASLFRVLGLLTGNDVNVTSSSVTVAEMMRYVLSQATHFYGAGKSSYIKS